LQFTRRAALIAFPCRATPVSGAVVLAELAVTGNGHAVGSASGARATSISHSSTSATPAVAAHDLPSAEDVGLVSGPAMFQLLNGDSVELLRASDADDVLSASVRQAEELVIAFGGTDAAGARWSYVMDGAAFRAAISDGFGSDAHPLDFSELVLTYLPGWPPDWDAEAKAEKAASSADSAEEAMGRARALDQQPAGPVRGGLTYVASPDGEEIAIFEGRDDAGWPWIIRFEGYALQATIAEARTHGG
jgi:hypothetical protein